ncbi:MAG: hypothetical protein P8L79_02330 [Rhodospirillaceae bacterium]|jgi:hypothetical protein|nr:hypothetical protein [Rhodospirillaceae bacterium]
MLMPHIYTDPMGHSLLDEIDLNMTAPGGAEVQEGTYYRRINSARQDVTDWQIGHALPGHFIDFTPTSAPTFIAVFSGQMHITVSNGEERQLARGDMMLAQDVDGQGHMTRFLGQEECNYLLVTMPGGLK